MMDSYSPLWAFARSREIHFTVDVADGECGKGGPWLGAMFEFGIAAYRSSLSQIGKNVLELIRLK